MELNEEELQKILAGTNQIVAEEEVLKNEELFREKRVEELKQQREEIVATLNEENQTINK